MNGMEWILKWNGMEMEWNGRMELEYFFERTGSLRGIFALMVSRNKL
jgi:hypothetical protein